ncbi:uncharacterized protein LOC144313027 isoform X2 [Canis aureus]
MKAMAGVTEVFLTEVKFFSGFQERFMTKKRTDFTWQRVRSYILETTLKKTILHFQTTLSCRLGVSAAVTLLGHVADVWAAQRHLFFSLNPLQVVQELPFFLFTWPKVVPSTNIQKVLVPPEYQTLLPLSRWANWPVMKASLLE